MARCAVVSGRSFVDKWLDVWINWEITILVFSTMSLQVFLVVAGFFRKHTSNPAFHASVWIAFLGLDATAAFSLSLMLGSGCEDLFSLYAPLVLFHLGAADTINAYSRADNELWRRYGFKMAIETMAAAYLVSKSSNCHKYLPSGIILFIVGAFKYGERIYSLWKGSQAQILISARPIHKLMELINTTPPSTALIVSGEWEAYRKFVNQPDDQKHRGGDYEQFDLHVDLIRSQVITYDDILSCEQLQKLTGRGYLSNVCLAHALFKVYMRRLANLPIHRREKDYEKVRNVLFSGAEEMPTKVRNVIDLELSFIFDSVYSKAASGTLYQGTGVLTRLVSAVLLFVAAMMLVAVDAMHLSCERSTIHLGVALAHLQVIAAFLVECLQIFKVIRSNWIRVWITCNYISQHGRAVEKQQASQTTGTSDREKSGLCTLNERATLFMFPFTGKPKHTHWNFRRCQLSILVDCLDSVCRHDLSCCEIDSMCDVKNHREEINNLNDVEVSELQTYLIKKIAKLSTRMNPIKGSAGFQSYLTASTLSWIVENWTLEEAILNWHLATSVCEMNYLPETNKSEKVEPVKMSIGLSRYCLYLMISRPKLMPEDRDVARGLYNQFKEELTRIYIADKHTKVDRVLLKAMDSLIAEPDSGTESIESGVKLGRNLLNEDKRWEILADVWVAILVFIATYENANPHIEQMARGGELITHLWVLLGHLGFGQRSRLQA